MKGHESATNIAAYVLQDLSCRGGCTDVSHGYMPIWEDEAEHIVQALADAGLLA